MNSPRMQRFGRILLVIFALACVLMTVACAEGEEPTAAAWGTIASLLPPVVAIVLALITKEVYSSLFLGIIVGCLLFTNGNPIDALQDFVSRLCSNAGGNMGILMFLVILGTMVALMIRAGGSKAYGDWAVSHIKTKSGALWSTFILAIVLGVDDYFNNLTTGTPNAPSAMIGMIAMTARSKSRPQSRPLPAGKRPRAAAASRRMQPAPSKSRASGIPAAASKSPLVRKSSPVRQSRQSAAAHI